MRTRTRYCQNPSDDGECNGESFQKSACPVDECVKLRWVSKYELYSYCSIAPSDKHQFETLFRNMCCQKVNANLPIYNSTIDFTIDQILFGKPVFRHVNYHDVFLYQSKNSTDWIIGKGLLQNSILYFGKSKSGLAQEGF